MLYLILMLAVLTPGASFLLLPNPVAESGGKYSQSDTNSNASDTEQDGFNDSQDPSTAANQLVQLAQQSRKRKSPSKDDDGETEGSDEDNSQEEDLTHWTNPNYNKSKQIKTARQSTSPVQNNGSQSVTPDSDSGAANQGRSFCTGYQQELNSKSKKQLDLYSKQALMLVAKNKIFKTVKFTKYEPNPDTNKRQEVKDLLESSGCSAALLVASSMKMDPNSAQFKDQWPTFKRVVEKKISARRSTVTGAMKSQAERKLRWLVTAPLCDVLMLYKNKALTSFFCLCWYRGLF